VEREHVITTIRVYRDTVFEVCVRDAQWAARARTGDPDVLGELLERACEATGLARAAYEIAVRDDPSLRELQRFALDEIFISPADPGPYAEISRESPAGTPENYHVHPWNGVTPPGGVGGSNPPPPWRL
jgi:hypothetical protein